MITADDIIMEKIFELSSDGIVITDGEGNCLKANEAYARISGMSVDYIVGKNHYDLEKNGEVRNSCVTRTLKEKKVITEYCEYVKTGKSALVTGVPIFGADRKIMMTIMNVRDFTELNDLKEKLLRERNLRKAYEKKMQREANGYGAMIVEDPQMLRLMQTVKAVSAVDSSILILGETGVGKDEVAKYIHQNSLRSQKPFVTINCGAIPESIAESELFGYEKGAFTGALNTGKKGLIEQAHGGTLFMDEIGELSLALQVKLLRVLQSGKVRHIGGKEEIAVDVRIISATNQNLLEMVAEGRFRDDFYYRISVIPLSIPPLRNRPGDIIPIAETFLDNINMKYGLRKHFSESAFKMLLGYDWPGNIRELKNVVERVAVTCSDEQIAEKDFPFTIDRSGKEAIAESNFSLPRKMEEIEYDYIKRAYEKYGNIREASKVLGMPMSTYARKKAQYEEKYNR